MVQDGRRRTELGLAVRLLAPLKPMQLATEPDYLGWGGRRCWWRDPGENSNRLRISYHAAWGVRINTSQKTFFGGSVSTVRWRTSIMDNIMQQMWKTQKYLRIQQQDWKKNTTDKKLIKKKLIKKKKVPVLCWRINPMSWNAALCSNLI